MDETRAALVNDIRLGWPTMSAFAHDARLRLPGLSLYVNGRRGMSPRTAAVVLSTLKTRVPATSITLESLLGVDAAHADAA